MSLGIVVHAPLNVTPPLGDIDYNDLCLIEPLIRHYPLKSFLKLCGTICLFNRAYFQCFAEPIRKIDPIAIRSAGTGIEF